MTEYAVRLTRLNYSYPDGTRALENFDIWAEAAARHADPDPESMWGFGIDESFPATAKEDGTIVIDFFPSKENPKICGIKVVPATP